MHKIRKCVKTRGAWEFESMGNLLIAIVLLLILLATLILLREKSFNLIEKIKEIILYR